LQQTSLLALSRGGGLEWAGARLLGNRNSKLREAIAVPLGAVPRLAALPSDQRRKCAVADMTKLSRIYQRAPMTCSLNYAAQVADRLCEPNSNMSLSCVAPGVLAVQVLRLVGNEYRWTCLDLWISQAFPRADLSREQCVGTDWSVPLYVQEDRARQL